MAYVSVWDFTDSDSFDVFVPFLFPLLPLAGGTILTGFETLQSLVPFYFSTPFLTFPTFLT